RFGQQILGPVETLREDDKGAYFEVPLFDTSYNRDLLPGLENGAYGVSFRFGIRSRDIMNRAARRSASNPLGLPERTLTDVDLKELGPVTWPAYAGATVGLKRARTHPTDQIPSGRMML